MAGGNQQLNFAIRAINEASKTLADVRKDLDDVGGAGERNSPKVGGFGESLRRVGEIATGFIAANVIQKGIASVTDFVGQSEGAAVALGESLNAVNQIFGEASDKVLQWGDDNANAFGLSQRAFNELATPLGAMLKNSGLAMDETADQTISLTKRAADMASVFNTDVSDALAAINAGLRGESDPLEKYGVRVSAAAVEQRALADSGKTVAKSLTEEEKALARINLIMEQTEAVAGDFAATSGDNANAARIATAEMEEQQALIGEKLIPVMAAWTQAKLKATEVLVSALVPAMDFVAKIVSDHVLPALQRMSAWVSEHVIPVLSEFAATVMAVVQRHVVPLLRQLGERVAEEFAKFQQYYKSDVKPAFDNIVAAVQWLVGEVEERWPLIWDVIEPVLTQIKDTIEFVFETVKGIIATALDLIQGDWEGAWENVKKILSGALTFVEETIGNILDFIKEAGGLLFEVAKDLGAELVKGLIAALKAGAGEIEQVFRDLIPDSIPLPGGVSIPIPDLTSLRIPGLAAGGVGHGLTWVGEEGPELVDFGRPSRVYSAAESGRIAGGRGGGTTTIHINMGLVTDPVAAAREIAAVLNRGAIHNGPMLNAGVVAP